jgi:hypothetical protein
MSNFFSSHPTSCSAVAPTFTRRASWLRAQVRPVRAWMTLGVAISLGSAGCVSGKEPPQIPAGGETAPLHFALPEEAVREAGRLLAQHDWATLSRYYDLSLTPQVSRAQLLDGSFFLNAAGVQGEPREILQWREPFAPSAKFVEAKALGDAAVLPCIWSVTAGVTIDQGGGPAQKVLRTAHLLQTKEGFRFLPTAATEPGPVTDQQWSAQGADPILLYRPALRARANAELPAGRSSNIPALVQWLEHNQAMAAAHPGVKQPGGKPWEPAAVYLPTDEELLVSLAGDRVWRSVQLAPPGTLASVQASHPDFSAAAIEYPHIEIVRVKVMGTGPQLYALPPVPRHVNLKGSP